MESVPPPVVDSLHRPSPDLPQGATLGLGQNRPASRSLQSDGMDGAARLAAAAGLSCGRIHAKEGTRYRVAPQASARTASFSRS